MTAVETAKRPAAASIKKSLDNGGSVNSVRIQLTLKPQYAKRLEEMKKVSDLGSYSEVIREALRVYDSILRNAGQEGRILIEKPDGSVVELVL